MENVFLLTVNGDTAGFGSNTPLQMVGDNMMVLLNNLQELYPNLEYRSRCSILDKRIGVIIDEENMEVGELVLIAIGPVE